ncbi:methylase [candidate division KSB3 bacterium]|uniref:Methylase n=1 Tax=candidate division KSB3 bacterium TaxID=2044937 RepID=A0A2G6EB45_9BACT|nr:MAG: methylase [candidate division KSB3 bacterium]PIE30766.1 MAG: methylase [candidate division KSB3 bacterium]
MNKDVDVSKRYKPDGQATRGKTACNRLRRVDTFLMRYDPGLITRQRGAYRSALFVDLGYGANPMTTLESAERLRRLNPNLAVLGVEIEAARVAAAKPYENHQTFFRLGGFNLPLETGADGRPERVRLLRVFNVLRQYQEETVAHAYEMLAPYVLPGGLLIEGTSDPFGRIWVANLARRAVDADVWTMEALVFSTNFRIPFEPRDFQTILPKNYIHRVVPGEAIYDFFQSWKHAARETRSIHAWGQRQWFSAAARHLVKRGYHINLRRKWLTRGWLIWKPQTDVASVADI